ncbi:L-carnitine dehydrogenase [Aestuariispira insulae]|uniref:L-carnitine dehydrogenase n=1 Tax=Aestuariispira insulae TaxID=1461337 RepID=A0A3D9HV59_9PROT|nr:L-carnitine dehydrogenase [Aestuariispira insulae]RED53347.1 carnitine 3-dehydrogenase [Aestuariispira insulae]
MSDIKTFGIIGTGVIGAGWAARALARGLDVVAWDPAPDAEEKLRAAVANAWPALIKMGLHEGASQDRLRFAASLEEMASSADFIQESAPERLDLKKSIHARLDAAARPGVMIASSTSGLLPTDFQADCATPERVLVGHPFNPVYLLPLVEVMAGEKTDPKYVELASDFYKSIGMYPLHVRNEIEGFLSDRLQEALWRENLHLVNDGIATTGELDDAIVYGPGLRWAFMGVNKTFHLAGGDAGMRHMLEQFGPALKLPWTKLEAPELTDQLIDNMVEGTKAQTEGTSVKELERMRDDCLIAIMNALKTFKEGAGRLLHEDEVNQINSVQSFTRFEKGMDIPAAPMELYRCSVRPDWVDYNSHMTEAAYLIAFGWATDALFRFIGDDEAYRASGLSFYTVETHINYFQECSTGDPLKFTTQLLGLDEKRMHFFHAMYHAQTGELLATTEQMLLHVDMNAAKACPIREDVYEALQAVMAAHAGLDVPEQVGRQMAIKKK